MAVLRRTPEPEGTLGAAVLGLAGLPLRPATVRALLGSRAGLAVDRGEPTGRHLTTLDPGWVLAQELDETDDLWLASRRPWWPAASDRGRQAIERLWRHGVATGMAARRLARERGRPDEARRLARLGFVHALGYWALAVVDPETLADLLDIDHPERRRREERLRLGQEAGVLGRELAARWALPAPWPEVIWLLDQSELKGPDWTSESEALELIRDARAWADRTPWSLNRDRARSAEAVSMPLRVRWLVAEVQSRTTDEFRASGSTAPEEALARQQAALLRDLEALRRRESERGRFLEQVAQVVPGPRLDRTSSRFAPTSDVLLERARAGLAWLESDRDLWKRRTDQIVSRFRRFRARVRDRLRHERLEALAEFAAGAGHELNNPLAVVMGRAQLLIGQTSGPEVHRSLRTIISQAQRAHRILRDLMYFARPGPARPRRCQPDAVMLEVVRDLHREAEIRGARIETVAPSTASWAWCDPDAIRQVADILIRNALEASGPGRVIRVSVRSQAERVRWSVSDQGPGLSPRVERHLLDPFFCGREAGRGLGLGLSRASRFLSRAGGRLTWRSRPGRGTTFQVDLPLAAMPEVEPAVTNPAGEYRESA